MQPITKEVVERYKDLLYKFQRTGECKPDNGIVFWNDIKQAFYEETKDRITANKVTGGCSTCQRKAINHLVRLYEHSLLESTTQRPSDNVQTTPRKKGRGRPRKQDKPTNE